MDILLKGGKPFILKPKLKDESALNIALEKFVQKCMVSKVFEYYDFVLWLKLPGNFTFKLAQ